jgi:hypothetical protein
MPNSQDYQIIRMSPGVNFAPLSNFGKAHPLESNGLDSGRGTRINHSSAAFSMIAAVGGDAINDDRGLVVSRVGKHWVR